MNYIPICVTDDEKLVHPLEPQKSDDDKFTETDFEKILNSFHENNILKISKDSESTLGKSICARNLKILEGDKTVLLENLYFSARQFEHGGPYRDVLNIKPELIKKDQRFRINGDTSGFMYNDKYYSCLPPVFFYTWLFIKEVQNTPEVMKTLCDYSVFISDLGDGELGLLQPYAAAMCVSLYRKGKISEFINNPELLRSLLNENINQYFIESEFYRILNSYFKDIELTKEESDVLTAFPSVFKEGDQITHPDFGEGTILKVEQFNTYGHLLVQFSDKDDPCLLSESWVRLHCIF